MPVEPAFHTGGWTAGWVDRRSNRLPQPPVYRRFRGTAGWNAGVWGRVDFSYPGGYFTIDFDFSNSPIVSLVVLRIAAATTCAFPFEGEYWNIA